MNHDGGISLNELVEVIKNNPSLASELHKHLGLPKKVGNPMGQQEEGESRDALVQAFTEMDKDGSGSIDFEEFAAALSKHVFLVQRKEYGFIFLRYKESWSEWELYTNFRKFLTFSVPLGHRTGLHDDRGCAMCYLLPSHLQR